MWTFHLWNEPSNSHRRLGLAFAHNGNLPCWQRGTDINDCKLYVSLELLTQYRRHSDELFRFKQIYLGYGLFPFYAMSISYEQSTLWSQWKQVIRMRFLGRKKGEEALDPCIFWRKKKKQVFNVDIILTGPSTCCGGVILCFLWSSKWVQPSDPLLTSFNPINLWVIIFPEAFLVQAFETSSSCLCS